jgi:hypothetical protein
VDWERIVRDICELSILLIGFLIEFKAAVYTREKLELSILLIGFQRSTPSCTISSGSFQFFLLDSVLDL